MLGTMETTDDAQGMIEGLLGEMGFGEGIETGVLPFREALQSIREQANLRIRARIREQANLRIREQANLRIRERAIRQTRDRIREPEQVMRIIPEIQEITEL